MYSSNSAGGIQGNGYQCRNAGSGPLLRIYPLRANACCRPRLLRIITSTNFSLHDLIFVDCKCSISHALHTRHLLVRSPRIPHYPRQLAKWRGVQSGHSRGRHWWLRRHRRVWFKHLDPRRGGHQPRRMRHHQEPLVEPSDRAHLVQSERWVCHRQPGHWHNDREHRLSVHL